MSQDFDFEEIFREAKQGLVAWEKGEHSLALETWGKLYKLNPEAFNSYQPLVNLIRDKQRQCLEEGTFEKELLKLIESYQSAKLEAEFAHNTFAKLLFVAGLMPQHWFEYDELKTSLRLWKIEANRQPFFPYNGYILGIIYCYSGFYNEASIVMQKAFDHIPSSKQKALKIEQLIRLIRQVVGEQKKAAQLKDNHSEQDWVSASFVIGQQLSSEELEAWRVSGLSPESARLWREKEFSAKEATRWAKGEFDLEQAVLWREQLSADPVFATQCKVAGDRKSTRLNSSH